MGSSRPASRRRSRRPAVVVGVLVASGVLASCTSATPRQVPVPAGDPTGCARLHRALPSDLDGRDRRDVTPTSTRTAAWGSPAVVLRCGVARPAGLRPTSQVIEVDGVDWWFDERPAAYVFTTVGRGTYVQVRVPSSVPRTEATGPLVDLAAAVKRSLPTR